jgi:hypothetical protein
MSEVVYLGNRLPRDPRHDQTARAFFESELLDETTLELTPDETVSLLDMTAEKLQADLQQTYEISAEEAASVCDDLRQAIINDNLN